MLKNAKNKQGALDFINFMLSPEQQVSVVKDIGGFPAVDWTIDEASGPVITRGIWTVAATTLPPAAHPRGPSRRGNIVMLSVSSDDDELIESLGNGASGYQLKSPSSDELLRALIAVRNGDTPLAPGLANRLAAKLASPTFTREQSARQSLAEAGLSTQQIDILRCVAQGDTYKTIAAEAHISDGSSARLPVPSSPQDSPVLTGFRSS